MSSITHECLHWHQLVQLHVWCSVGPHTHAAAIDKGCQTIQLVLLKRDMDNLTDTVITQSCAFEGIDKCFDHSLIQQPNFQACKAL